MSYEDILAAQSTRHEMETRLPVTAWRVIVQHLSDCATDLLTLSQLSLTLKDVCRPHLSTHFEVVHPQLALLNREYPWHYLLMLVLESYVDPLFIYELYCEQAGTVETPSSRIGRPSLASNDAESILRYDTLYRAAAACYMPGDIVEEAHFQFINGSGDAALAVLLPQCRRLKRIDLHPLRMPMVKAVFLDAMDKHRARGIYGAMARQHAKHVANIDSQNTDNPIRRRYARPDEADSLPFAELLFIHSQDYTNCRNETLAEFLPFLGIPSLHRIILYTIRRQTHPDASAVIWPPGVECHCPEIYFARSSLDKETLTSFAEGIVSDCDIRQWYEFGQGDPDNLPEDKVWDHALIEFDAAGRKTVRIRVDYGEGGPGYAYEWICSVYYGRYTQWWHMDDDNKIGPLTYQEADEWLGGPL